MIVVAGALLALAGCGGGGAADPVAADDTVVPDSALASSREFAQWVGSRRDNDSGEPLSMNAMMPPASDGEEPIDVD
jgi:hypothetical protein